MQSRSRYHDASAPGINVPALVEGASPAIEVDPYPSDSYMDEDFNDGSSTQSLTNSVFAVARENGRTYQGWRAGTYPFPNDPDEQDRLDFQFCVLHEMMGKKLHYAPLQDPRHIFDIGVWAIEMGDKFPNCLVEATDLSPIQPSSVPENVHFLIDDAENEDWLVPPNHYDYIHTSMLLGCFPDFSEIVRKAFLHTKPGGWMESQELMSKPYCDDGTMTDEWAFSQWARLLDEAAESRGRPLRMAPRLKQYYLDAGFVDVQERVFVLPLNTWPKDHELKKIGAWWSENMLLGLQAFTLAYFSRELGWSRDAIEVYMVNVRSAITEQPPKVHAYHKFYIVWGRKPYADEVVPYASRDTSSSNRRQEGHMPEQSNSAYDQSTQQQAETAQTDNSGSSIPYSVQESTSNMTTPTQAQPYQPPTAPAPSPHHLNTFSPGIPLQTTSRNQLELSPQGAAQSAATSAPVDHQHPLPPLWMSAAMNTSLDDSTTRELPIPNLLRTTAGATVPPLQAMPSNPMSGPTSATLLPSSSSQSQQQQQQQHDPDPTRRTSLSLSDVLHN